MSPFSIDRAAEVGLLRPELGRGRRLLEQVGNEVRSLDPLARRLRPEVVRDQVTCHHPGVVPKPVHGCRRGADAVLAQAGRSLGRVAGEVDPGAQLALPERRHGGDAPLRDRAHAQLAKVEQRRREAGSGDHVVDLELDVARPRRALADDVPALADSLEAIDGEVEGEGAAAERVVLERLEVAHADGRLRQHARQHGPGGSEHDLPRPGQEPVGDLEGRVALPDHEDAPSAVLLRVAGVDVVRDAVDARDGREPGRRHPEREDRRPARVLAVGGRQHEPAVVGAPRRLPRAAVANRHRDLLGEGGEAGLHLGPRGNDVRAVHERRDERLMLGLVRDEAVVVVPLVLARARLGRRVRLRPREQALEDRKLPEHASRRVVPRDGRAVDAEPREAVARLQAAGPASDHDDGVVARRKRTVVPGLRH